VHLTNYLPWSASHHANLAWNKLTPLALHGITCSAFSQVSSVSLCQKHNTNCIMCYAGLQGISSKGAASIAAALQDHQSLQQLVMAHNHLSDEGEIDSVLNALHHCG